MFRSLVRTFSFFFLLLFCASLAFADALHGRVLDPQKQPVRGAKVLVLRGNVVVLTATTASDGTFGPLQLPAGEYDLDVAAPGLGGAPRHITITSGKQTIDVTLDLVVRAMTDSVVVSAAQVDQPLSRVPDSVTVVDRQDLEARQIDSVADAVRLAPGMAVVASGAPGAVTSFFPRGGNSNYTLVLVDGIPQNSFGGGFDAAHLGTAGVERVEIVHGPQSALFGGGAIGAVVQVVTRQGGPPAADASFEGGAYGTFRGTASASGSRGAWSWSGAAETLHSDGDTRCLSAIRVTTTPCTVAAGGKVSNDDYLRQNASGGLNWSGANGAVWRLNVRGGVNEVGAPGPYGSDPMHLYGGIDTVSRDRNHTIELGSSAVLPMGDRVTHRVQATWADLYGYFISPYGNSFDQSKRASGRYQLDFAATSSVGVSVGSEALDERADNTFVTGAGSQAIPITRVIWGSFGEVRDSIGGRAFINAGVRLERIQLNALQGDGFSRPAFANQVVWSVNPKVALAWFLHPADANGWTKLHAGAGTGIKPPTTFDIAFTNNPDLKPERNVSVDAGIEQAVLKQRVVFDATYFHNRYNDLIVTVGSSFSGASKYSSDNIANARARGLELGATWKGPQGVGARLAYTWLDTAVLGIDNAPAAAPFPFTVGQPLFRRPKNQATVDLTWANTRGDVFVSAGGRGKTLDIEPNYGSSTDINPGYVVLSSGGAVWIDRSVQLFARATNLLNRHYEEAYGFPALGRAAMIGIRVARGR